MLLHIREILIRKGLNCPNSIKFHDFVIFDKSWKIWYPQKV